MKVRERYPDESNALGRWEYRPDQAQGELTQLLPRLDRLFHRPAAGGNLKVSPFDLDRNGPATSIRFLTPGPDVVSHRDNSGFDLNGINQVFGESRF